MLNEASRENASAVIYRQWDAHHVGQWRERLGGASLLSSAVALSPGERASGRTTLETRKALSLFVPAAAAVEEEGGRVKIPGRHALPCVCHQPATPPSLRDGRNCGPGGLTFNAVLGSPDADADGCSTHDLEDIYEAL